MSATLDAAAFAAYFGGGGGGGGGGVPILAAGGRTFPVQQVGGDVDQLLNHLLGRPLTLHCVNKERPHLAVELWYRITAVPGGILHSPKQPQATFGWPNHLLDCVPASAASNSFLAAAGDMRCSSGVGWPAVVYGPARTQEQQWISGASLT